MKLSLNEFQKQDQQGIKDALFNCCGSTKWVGSLMAKMPFASEEELYKEAKQVWFESCDKEDYLEAFSHHPKIGDKESLREKFANTKDWAKEEQAGAADADDELLTFLAKRNQDYLDKFGYIFLVCATGKSAHEMSRLLQYRFEHKANEELVIARNEQFKISLLRLQKLMDLKASFWSEVSHVTTHVLDTSIGSPGKGICIRLKEKNGDQFLTTAIGISNADGRIANLVSPGIRLKPGHYQMCFDTAAYFRDRGVNGFYPKVDIDFEVFDETHYHVPLLINPFGFSTYRGS